MPTYVQTQQIWTTTSATAVFPVQEVVLDGVLRVDAGAAGGAGGEPVGGGVVAGAEVAAGVVAAADQVSAVAPAMTEIEPTSVGVISLAVSAGLPSGTRIDGTITAIRQMAAMRPTVRHRWASLANGGVRSPSGGVVSSDSSNVAEGVASVRSTGVIPGARRGPGRPPWCGVGAADATPSKITQPSETARDRRLAIREKSARDAAMPRPVNLSGAVYVFRLSRSPSDPLPGDNVGRNGDWSSAR
ncbi:hypothetical protein ACQEVZ_39805 [Dactylosporangium sp. CA-152071]|uniref:hypothetical protein n=1 Tax=Dactylosporangium sp. CA-152071 TaxID=3239933 RepID=UPI003D8CEC26